jgi:hypothetical protein
MTFADPDYGTQISALFMPRRADDLKPGAAAFIGERINFSFVGYVDVDGPYEGQSQWMPEQGQMHAVAWVPACDLSDVLEK